MIWKIIAGLLWSVWAFQILPNDVNPLTSPLWALSLLFGQPHLNLYLFWVHLRTISLLTRLFWAHWRHASYKRRYKVQICQRQKLSTFLNVKKTRMTSEEKKGFKIHHTMHMKQWIWFCSNLEFIKDDICKCNKV